MIIREAVGSDAAGIRDVFLACYGSDYPYREYYDIHQLTRMIYTDDTLLLVVEDEDARVVGTASVILEAGALSDLVGEFGRLAVHPDARNNGYGKALMEERLRRIEGRLHVGLIEGRVTHPYTLKIAEAQGFAPVGYLPQKMRTSERESLALLVRHFGESLELRRNHPRLIPEAHALAHRALSNCRMPVDVIVDEGAAPYPRGHDYAVEELTTEGYAYLLRIERGRVRNREIFGPMRLHYGFFKLRARSSDYLLARDGERIAGAIGFTRDPLEQIVRIFELIVHHDAVVSFLLGELERLCRCEWQVNYIEVDVSAYSPRMQRTLLELGFVPVGYVPAQAFHEVERLDVLKMARVLTALEEGTLSLTPAVKEVAEIVTGGVRQQSVMPRMVEAARGVDLFQHLNDEQTQRLASVFAMRQFAPGETIFREGEESAGMYVVLEGAVTVQSGGSPVGTVQSGECLGEQALLTGSPHSVTAVATSAVEAGAICHAEMTRLVRQRPDIGVLLYHNLAVDVSQKLRRAGPARET